MCATWLASFIFACACYITGWPIKLLKLLLISTCCYNELKFIIYTFVLSVIETMKMISCLSKWDQDLPIKDDRRIMICDVRDGSRILFLQVWVGLVCCHGCLNWISLRACSVALDIFWVSTLWNAQGVILETLGWKKVGVVLILNEILIHAWALKTDSITFCFWCHIISVPKRPI